ncbi:hypothetical protein FRC06_009518 [Ceratobasidium sp. 370]|nr:hypothetical protein FRC06_009518 [Ceratobasidium sp. 370]
MRTSTLFNFLLALILCLFSVGLSSPAPIKAADDGAPALIEPMMETAEAIAGVASITQSIAARAAVSAARGNGAASPDIIVIVQGGRHAW